MWKCPVRLIGGAWLRAWARQLPSNDPTAWGEWSRKMVTAQLNPVGVGIHSVLIATDFSRYSSVAVNLDRKSTRLNSSHSHHDALPMLGGMVAADGDGTAQPGRGGYPQCAHRDGLFPLLQRCCELWPRTGPRIPGQGPCSRSEEHTSELQ